MGEKIQTCCCGQATKRSALDSDAKRPSACGPTSSFEAADLEINGMEYNHQIIQETLK